VTVRELPVSKSMAGVNMRLTAGGVRELHWHTAGEWAIMLYGTARITAIDAEGKSFVADVKKNDLWYFPSGIPHSIQGLDPDGAEFMLVFDDGDFSEAETVLLSDSMAHLPREVLSKNFGVADRALENLPKQELFIFQTEVPGSLEADQKAASGTPGKSPVDLLFARWKCRRRSARKAERCALLIRANSRCQKRLRWQWSRSPGRAAGTALASERRRVAILHQRKGTDDGGGDRQPRAHDGLQAGDVGYVEKTLLHYIENTGDTDLVFLEMFRAASTKTFRCPNGWPTLHRNLSWRTCVLTRRPSTRFPRRSSW